MLPQARTDGEDYSDVESDEEEDEEDSSKSEDEEEKGPQVGVAGRKTHLNKAIEKRKKGIGRYKANGNRKTKEWIMKKKDRMRRQGTKVKSDSKYSGRRRPVAYS